jgi:hypothetical protein
VDLSSRGFRRSVLLPEVAETREGLVSGLQVVLLLFPSFSGFKTRECIRIDDQMGWAIGAGDEDWTGEEEDRPRWSSDEQTDRDNATSERRFIVLRV